MSFPDGYKHFTDTNTVDAFSIIHTPSTLGVSRVFRTASTGSIAVLTAETLPVLSVPSVVAPRTQVSLLPTFIVYTGSTCERNRSTANKM